MKDLMSKLKETIKKYWKWIVGAFIALTIFFLVRKPKQQEQVKSDLDIANDFNKIEDKEDEKQKQIIEDFADKKEELDIKYEQKKEEIEEEAKAKRLERIRQGNKQMAEEFARKFNLKVGE